MPRHGRDRLRLEVAAAGGDVVAEIDRLVTLGASRIAADHEGLAVLADPDGNEFTVTSPASSALPGG